MKKVVIIRFRKWIISKRLQFTRFSILGIFGLYALLGMLIAPEFTRIDTLFLAVVLYFSFQQRK